jgi:hypothetical protein
MKKNDINILSEAYTKKIIKEYSEDYSEDYSNGSDEFSKPDIADKSYDKQKFMGAKIIGIERLNEDYDSSAGEKDSITILTDKGNIVIGSSDDLMVEYSDGNTIEGDEFSFKDDDDFDMEDDI